MVEYTHLTEILKKTGINNLMNFNQLVIDEIFKFCSIEKGAICGKVIQTIINKNNHNTNRIDWANILDLFENEPGGTSTKNLQHWMQVDHSKKMAKFDYGSKKLNRKYYGQNTPPTYDYSKFKDYKIKSFVTWSDADPFSEKTDNVNFENLLSEEGKSVVTFYKMKNYNHLDYIWSSDAVNDLYKPIIEFLESN